MQFVYTLSALSLVLAFPLEERSMPKDLAIGGGVIGLAAGAGLGATGVFLKNPTLIRTGGQALAGGAVGALAGSTVGSQMDVSHLREQQDKATAHETQEIGVATGTDEFGMPTTGSPSAEASGSSFNQ
jgi:hypothetical protein